jgi:lipoate-protein ligase A
MSDADWLAIEELHDRKYGTWEWNYGENPASNVERSKRFPAGELDVRLDVQQGRIASVRIFGDFMGRVEVARLEEKLHGLPYEREAIAGVLSGVDVSEYFGEVAVDDVLELLSP